MPIPEFLQPWLNPSREAFLALGSLLGLLLLALLIGAWLLFGRGPRRRRAFQRARRTLQRGAWQEALTLTQTLQSSGRLSAMWQGRLRNLEGECQHTAADQALAEKHYEESQQHYQAAARLLSVDGTELHQRVIEAMLSEVRTQFAAGRSGPDNESIQQLIARVLTLQSPCAEASFWQGMCHLRAGRMELALQSLAQAQQESKPFIDPPLYQGALLLRAGRPQEALRHFSEANKIDSTCPFVTWQLGTAIVAAGGDSGLAARALQRALGPKGLGLWAGSPERAWIEAFPEGRSHVRRLASRHRYVCPVFGGDLNVMIQQGQQALAQAQYRLGNYQEASDLYAKLLQDCPPTVPLLRGLGLSLARLERYDQAYKHLRTALEQEEPKDPFTAGYLALCGALGKPTRPEDKHRNVAWAIRLLNRFDLPGNAEWAYLHSAVFAEARQIGLPAAVEDQLRLCDVLVSVHATDPAAAAAFAHLAGSFPEAVRPEHAYHYGKAAQEHGFRSEHDLALFGQLFRDPPAARGYYQQQHWCLDEVEYTFLERRAALQPGSFPPELGESYPARGEPLLLERSQRLEAANQADAALASAEVLLQLAPRSGPAHDRLAQLHYRRGELDRAASLLAGWQRLEPNDHLPLVRRAVIEQQRANGAEREQAIRQALELTQGKPRAQVAYLGARLALQEVRGEDWRGLASSPISRLLQECLADDPDHVDALWLLAAVRSVSGDREGLAMQARDMDRPEVADPRFHYLAAVCHLAARDYACVLEASRRTLSRVTSANSHPASPLAPLAVEAEYLMGWAYLHLQDFTAAAQALTKTAAAPQSFSGAQARALLGDLCFARGDYEDAIRWWNALDAAQRSAWQLDEPLRATVFLSGLLAYQGGQFEQAAEKFREAGRLGLRERSLGSLMALAYFKAGQRLLFEEEAKHVEQGPI